MQYPNGICILQQTLTSLMQTIDIKRKMEHDPSNCWYIVYTAEMKNEIIQPHQWQETSLHCRGFLQFLLQVFGLFSFLCDLFLPQHKPLKKLATYWITDWIRGNFSAVLHIFPNRCQLAILAKRRHRISRYASEESGWQVGHSKRPLHMTLHMCPMGPAAQQFLAVSSAILRSSASAAPFLPARFHYIVFMAVWKQEFQKWFRLWNFQISLRFLTQRL